MSSNFRSRAAVLNALSLAIALSALAACGNRGPSTTAGVSVKGEGPTVTTHLDHDALARGEHSVTEALEHGEHLFTTSFNTFDGAGRPTSTGTGEPRSRRSLPHNVNRISGPDANSCAGCHNLPRPGGGGDNVANVFVLAQRLPHANFDGLAGDNFQDHDLENVGNERNTLGMWGSGYIELLAREITASLHRQRDAALANARAGGAPVTVTLRAKGIGYGRLTARPDGTLDTTALEGIDGDLVVKPFHQKGVVVSLRQFTNNALNHHHGMQSQERFGEGADPDGDGHTDELTPGDLTAISLWQATLPVPGLALPRSGPEREAARRGAQLFGSIGCATCHVPELVLDSAMFSEPNPYNPRGNLRPEDVAAPVTVDLTEVGPGPRLSERGDGRIAVPAFTDLKRHDMGPGLDDEQLEQGGVPTNEFLTRKLWGMASEPPYLHNGCATTLTEAIVMHGGEARASREAFEALDPADAAAVVTFLRTLQVLPEDSPPVVDVEPTGYVGDAPALQDGHVDQADIDAGLWSTEDLFDRGREVFAASFNTLDGAGRPMTTGTGEPRSHHGFPRNFNRLSGPDANSCAGCHNVPAVGGGGDNVANVFVLAQRLPHVNFDGGPGDNFLPLTLETVGNERNTLGMWGSGFIEMLAREMTVDLQEQRRQAALEARALGEAVTVRLESKGVSFGRLRALPGGALDTRGVEGVDDDLVVKPFHQKGVVVSLRQFSNNAFNHHHGMQSAERFGFGLDPDGDGVTDELTPGDLTAVTLFQALLPVPEEVVPDSARERQEIARGRSLFTAVGCAGCHVPALRLDDPVFTEPNPFNPVGNLRPGDVPQPYAVDLVGEGSGHRLTREPDGSVLVPAYTDLKRHDLGEEVDNETIVQGGVPTSVFLTRKLWGMASEPPFMHHGRAYTLGEAIELHGGEAADSRARFRELGPTDQRLLLAFLKTLQVRPPETGR